MNSSRNLIRCVVAALAASPGLAAGARRAAADPVPSGPVLQVQGDVSDLRVVRRIEQHADTWRVWQPFLVPGGPPRHLLVAFGAMANGKKDMGHILASLSPNDGDTSGEPVKAFDDHQRQGAIQFACANPVLFRAPGQDVIWCFAMRCPIAYENSEESQRVAAVTADGGRTGSTAAAEPELHDVKAKGFFGRAANGTHLFVYDDGPARRDRTWPGFPNGGRTSLRYKTTAPAAPGARKDLLRRRHQEFPSDAGRGRTGRLPGRLGQRHGHRAAHAHPVHRFQAAAVSPADLRLRLRADFAAIRQGPGASVDSAARGGVAI